MPKPLILYRVETQDGRAWLWLSHNKPTAEHAADLCGVGKGQIQSIQTATADDAGALKPDAEEFVGLIITED